jgi:hypothetical protein
MQSSRLAKGDLTERYRQLAGEVVVQMISDIKLLNRRKILSGLVSIAKPRRNAGFGDGYKSYIESDELVRAVRGEPMATWLMVAGANVGHRDVVRRLEKLTPEGCRENENRKFHQPRKGNK